MFEVVVTIFTVLMIGMFILGWTAAMAGVLFEMGVRSFEFVNERVEGETCVTKAVVWISIVYLVILFTSGAFT